MLTEVPPSYHPGEDIHEQSDINEASFESDVGYIANPHLIPATDFKVFEAIQIGLRPFKRSRGLTGKAFHRHREILFFHQSGDAAIPNAVSVIRQQPRDTPIPVCRIPPT